MSCECDLINIVFVSHFQVQLYILCVSRNRWTVRTTSPIHLYGHAYVPPTHVRTHTHIGCREKKQRWDQEFGSSNPEDHETEARYRCSRLLMSSPLHNTPMFPLALSSVIALPPSTLFISPLPSPSLFPSFPTSLTLIFLPLLPLSFTPPSPPAGAPLDSDIPTSVFHPPTRETALTPTSTFGPKPFLFVPEQVRRPKHSFVPRKVSPVCVSRENGENGERVKSFSLPPSISQGAATNHRSCSRLSSHFESSGSVHMHFSTTYVKSIVYVHVLKRNLWRVHDTEQRHSKCTDRTTTSETLHNSRVLCYTTSVHQWIISHTHSQTFTTRHCEKLSRGEISRIGWP